jgi:hypothetical protein
MRRNDRLSDICIHRAGSHAKASSHSNPPHARQKRSRDLRSRSRDIRALDYFAPGIQAQHQAIDGSVARNSCRDSRQADCRFRVIGRARTVSRVHTSTLCRARMARSPHWSNADQTRRTASFPQASKCVSLRLLFQSGRAAILQTHGIQARRHDSGLHR